MTGEKKSSDLSSRLSVKRGARLISKTSRSSSNTISSPPKAAIAAPNAKKDEVHRRRNPFNDMLRRGSTVESSKDILPSTSGPESMNKAHSSQPSEEDLDVRTAARVPELERALAIAEEEQDALRKELETVRQHARLDQDTIEDLRHQLAESHQNKEGTPSVTSSEHQRDSEPRPSLERPNEDILRQNYELRYRVAQLQEQLVGHGPIQHDRASLREEDLNDLRIRLHATEKESQERLQQLLSLKSSISSLTRMDSQITDSELTESFSQLANRIREWVISNFRRCKLDLDHMPSETLNALKFIIPNYKNVDASDRIALLQAFVSSALMQIFQEPVIVGLPDSGPLAAIRQCAEVIQGPILDYGDREWRRATIRALEGSAARHTIRQGREHALQRIAGDLSHLLFTLTAVSLTPSGQLALIGIFNTAADLQRLLALQKARYHVLYFCNHKEKDFLGFDDRRMESINDLDRFMDEDGDTPTERRFLFCVFPCIEKHGDERGEHLETSNVLLKARVCCGVG